MPARSFGPYSSDGIPVRAGAKVQLRVKQTSGDPQQLAKLRFGIAQLEPQGSGGLTLPAFGGGAPSGPTVELGVISANSSDDSFWIFDEVTGAETSTSRNVGIVAMNRDIARCPITGDLFVGDGDNFKRLEAGTLDPLWSQPRENVGGNGRTRVSPDGTLLAHSGGTMVDVHDAETGAFIAATPADSQSGSNPNVPGFETNERLIFAGRFVSNADVAYYDLDPITDPIDQLLVSAGIGGFFASGLGCAEGIIVAGSSGGVVTRLDLSGTILWQTPSGSGTNPHVYAIEIDVENERAYALRRRMPFAGSPPPARPSSPSSTWVTATSSTSGTLATPPSPPSGRRFGLAMTAPRCTCPVTEGCSSSTPPTGPKPGAFSLTTSSVAWWWPNTPPGVRPSPLRLMAGLR